MMASSNGSSKSSHFRTVQRFRLDYAPVDVTQYESTRTGMRAVVVDQKGPKVNGYFALATEVLDDSGAPHTLEHLVFLGSRSYRYKGLLDKLATRAYSTTNAWTATDQTVYTLSTAGWKAFAQVLPVYLEHLILPTLTDSGCLTEVYHVDGEGHDAGVVYSEMQGVQNSASELIDLKSKRLLYPEGNGFRYETGGMMEALRVLTADRIRSFHKDMYQPKNTCLVITGDVDHADLLSILDTFESTIIDDVPKPGDPFKRPWVDSESTPPLKETIVTTVKFPEEDESVGETLTCWFGPSCNDSLNSAAIEILLTYLAGSSISVLENTLVEKEQRSSGVYYNTDYRPNVVVSLSLSAVETDKLAETEQRLLQLIVEVASKPLDLEYMHDCISRFRRQIKIRCEEAGDFFAEPIIVDHLYGKRDGSDLRDLATLAELDELANWTDTQWRDFLKKWLVDAPHVSILGEPSAELSQKIKDEEKARVKALQEKLGPNGLKRLAEKLEQAKAENDVPIPDHVLEAFPLPDTDSVHFISTVSAGAGPARKSSADNAIQKIVDADKSTSGLSIHFEHIPSNFIRIKVDLGVTAVPIELLPLISLYTMNFFTTPVTINGKRVEFEDVVTQLERDTIAYGIGTEYGNAEVLALWFELEPKSYTKVIDWIRTFLFDAIHDPARLYASLTKILADVPDEMRSGRSMLTAVSFMAQYERESSLRASSTLSKALYLKRIRKLLKQDPEAVIKKFSDVCKAISRPENIRIKVAADVEHLDNPVSSWDRLVKGGGQQKQLDALPNRRAMLSKAGQTPGSYAYVVPIAAIDSSFAVLIGNGIDNYEHPDLPALMTAVSYLDSVEGPLWIAVRGQGFAYGSAFSRNVDTGMLSYNLWRSPAAFKAFAAAKEQVDGYASGKLKLDRLALEGAVSSIVLAIADEQPSISSAAESSFVNQAIRGIDKDWAHKMLLRVREVTPDEVREAMRKYMVPIFTATSANLVITCSKLMTEELLSEFGKAGFKIEERSLDSFYDDYGLAAPDGEDDSDEVDEDDDDDADEDDGAVHTPQSEDDE